MYIENHIDHFSKNSNYRSARIREKSNKSQNKSSKIKSQIKTNKSLKI